MDRLFTQPASDATGAAAQLFTAIKGAIGKVPNAYLALGNNSPVALEAVLNLDGALRKSSLGAQDIEVIKLAVSQDAGCDYCVAAHTLMGGKAGLSAEAMRAARKGGSTGAARLDALAAFAHTLVGTSGTVPDHVLAAARAAGVTDAQLADTTLAIAAITLTNLFNRINDTTVDFPAVA
jgi:AhpD family alkylhydroperoxidase